MRISRRLGAVLLPAVLLLAACGGGESSNYSEKTDKLEVLSWWVSPSEHPALEVLLNAFGDEHSGVEVIDGSIEGGAGSNVQIALAERLRANDPPDVWQTFEGSSLAAWADSGRIVDVDDLYEEANLESLMPAKLYEGVTHKDKQWGMPTGAHRGNNLWFNKQVLTEAGIATPAAGYTADQFEADLETLAGKDKTPLCLGAKDRFTSVELFENTLLGEIGTDGWQRIADDKFDWTGDSLKSALGTFADIVKHADPAAGGLTWSEAAKKFTEGQCGFLSMNDSVYGEFIADGATDADFGYVAYPGTDGAYLAIVDTFVAASGAENGVNALDFLRTIAQPETSLEFNKLKGSVPIRNDVDVAQLSPYQQSASNALWHDTILMSLTHGELLGADFQMGLYDAVSAFVTGRDQRTFIDTLQQSITIPIPGR